MSKKIGICVIGLGIGNAHASNYALMKDDVDLFVCDVNDWKFACQLGYAIGKHEY